MSHLHCRKVVVVLNTALQDATPRAIKDTVKSATRKSPVHPSKHVTPTLTPTSRSYW